MKRDSPVGRPPSKNFAMLFSLASIIQFFFLKIRNFLTRLNIHELLFLDFSHKSFQNNSIKYLKIIQLLIFLHMLKNACKLTHF